MNDSFALWVHKGSFAPADSDLRDYKVMCFDGDPKLIQVHAGRYQGVHTQDIYDSSWNRTDITQVGLPMSSAPDEKPEFLDEILERSKTLSAGMAHVRVDWFMANGGLRFGEMTFYDAAGFDAFDDYADDLKLGSWIELPCGGGWLNVTNSLVVRVLPEPEPTSHEMTDYKFYCFDGEPKFLYVSQGLENHETARISFLETDWSFAPFRRGDYASFEELPQKPASYDEMLGLARKLSEGIPFVRADFFEYKGKPRFSEMTFSPCAGHMPFEPQEWDLRVGEMLELPNW